MSEDHVGDKHTIYTKIVTLGTQLQTESDLGGFYQLTLNLAYFRPHTTNTDEGNGCMVIQKSLKPSTAAYARI